MAIVKFISENSCQIFVDMELVGEVQACRMLKVSLETGSYLVEVKDAEGNYLKKYELKISSADTQVLQDLTTNNYFIAETLEKMKSDSSLRFYNQRAIFCYNNRYGYINSQYEVVVKPIFSFAENFNFGYALVKKLFPNGEKTTIIDIDGNIKYERWFDYVGDNEKTLLLRYDNTFIVISKSNFSIVKEYLDADYDGRGKLIPVHQHIGIDDMYGFIDKAGNEIIPFIYDYAWNFNSNNLATVKRFGEYNSVDLSGNLYRYGVHSYMNEMEKKIGNDESVGTNPNYIEYLSKEDSLYRGFPDHFGIYPIKKNSGWKLQGHDSERWDRIFNYHDNCLVYRENGLCTFQGDMSFSIEADEIIPVFSWDGRPTKECKVLTCFVIKKNWKYGIINPDKNVILPTDYDLIVPTDAYEGKDRAGSSDIAIVWKNKKCTLFKIDTGVFIFPFDYDDIVVNEYYDNSLNPMEDCTYMMKTNGKYGIIANDFKTVLLPYEYDSIKEEFACKLNTKGEFYSCKRMILCKENKYGIWQKFKCRNNDTEWQLREYDIRIEENYDECVFIKDKNNSANLLDVAVRSGNKWALFHSIVGKEKINNGDMSFEFDSFDELKESHKKTNNDCMTVPPVLKL